ncbi:MAG: rRNA maturation RNase YbeY [Lachnospiraceae bacterium]|nr:rRNA maturation RNase YbeY [Lachnospiraceae bacterium]
MTILFEEETQIPFSFDYRAIATAVIEKALETESFPYEVEVGLTLTDDTAICQINKEFREKDSATDVLSFPMIDYENPGDFSHLEDMDEIFHPETGEVVLGDIVISVDHVMSQAREYGHSVKREYAFLIAHSMLHLMGYDHMEHEEAEIMEQKQRTILDLLNITREEREDV